MLHWLQINALRYAFGFVLIAMGIHTVHQSLKTGPLTIGYGHGHRLTIAKPSWYTRALWLCVGLVFLTGGFLFVVLPVYSRAKLGD